MVYSTCAALQSIMCWEELSKIKALDSDYAHFSVHLFLQNVDKKGMINAYILLLDFNPQ